MGTEAVALLVLVSIGLVVLVAVRPGLARSQGGKILAFLALFLVPVATVRVGLSTHMEASKTTQFCMSCHVMEPYGQSLLVADQDYLPAGHFQNRRVDRDHACFTCHTQYTMFGDMKAKMNGLKHMLVYYSGSTPDEIELYSPYRNRECLHCHVGARRFDELHSHDMAELTSNSISCMDCHGKAHEIETVAHAEMWQTDLDKTLEGGPLE